jgi:eukaryotic-like serine/threonine-protein kinase
MKKAPYKPGQEIAPGIQVLEHLRRGTDLDVYDCWSSTRYCRCFVKTVRPDRAHSRGTRRRLVREGRLLLSFTHPHLVRAYDLIDEGPPSVPVLVLETLTGATLSHLLRGGRRLPLTDVAFLGRHLCSAIRYLHDHGYLHLDLKPSNIISDGGRARVIDLSLVRRPGKKTRGGRGTSTHMSPEQARGGELTTAADVWGIGLVLYEAATGYRPFDDDQADSSSAHSYLQLTRPAPAIRTLRRVPAPLGKALDACLLDSPAARPTIAELDDCLAMITGRSEDTSSAAGSNARGNATANTTLRHVRDAMGKTRHRRVPRRSPSPGE